MIREIFAGKHNPSTVIRVTYGRDAGDGSSGLDVLLSGIVKARFYNPEGVNDWFKNNSKANLEAWRKAYHTSGLSAGNFRRPFGGNVVLDVPHYSQRDNKLHPFGTCNVTSMAMIHAFHKLPRKMMAGQREDELSTWLAQMNLDRHSHADLVRMNQAYGFISSFSTSRTWDEIRAQIRAGLPVVMAGKFTRSGHIIVLRGTEGDDFIVNDPFGNGLLKYRGQKGREGEALKYPIEYLSKVTPYPGEKGVRGHFNRPR